MQTERRDGAREAAGTFPRRETTTTTTTTHGSWRRGKDISEGRGTRLSEEGSTLDRTWPERGSRFARGWARPRSYDEG